MCGRYVLVQKIELIEQRFNVTLLGHFDWSPSYNIGPSNYAPVITQEDPYHLQLFRFGMRSQWSKKGMCLFNARSEGDCNKENDTSFRGSMDIITKPSFRKPIRSQRCLVIADAFYEGSEKKGLDEAHVVFLQNKMRPFAFAGIYDTWKNIETGEILNSFSIITTVANDLMKKIPRHRSPIILTPESEKRWLQSQLALRDVTKMLRPFSAEFNECLSCLKCY